MDRHTKIRAWLPKTQEMVIPYACIQGHGWYLHKEDLWGHDITIEESNEKAIYMEPTGLKDKNGQEIYEGDIVAVWTGYPVCETDYFSVEYDQGAFFLKNERGNFHTFLQEYGTTDEGNNTLDVEIIGNKFENPELLED